MTLKDTRFTGAFTAITTPFTADGSAIDRDRLATQIVFQAQGGLKGIVISGTTGESKVEGNRCSRVTIPEASRRRTDWRC